MRCEIIAIGSELLLGQIVDTNSTWIAQRLAQIGVDCHYQTRVGDNLARIENALRIALTRADCVITCGGLGPTQDDITREAIAKVMGVPLLRDANLLKRIEDIFKNRQRPFLEINQVQADLPQGATAMQALPGTAPGLICPVGRQVIYAVPGVPGEMQEMLKTDIIPDLRLRQGAASTLVSHSFYTLGCGESAIADLLSPCFAELAASGNPTLAFLASDKTGVRVRLTAKADDHASAQQLLAAEISKVRDLIKEWIYCESEDEAVSPEAVLLARLQEQGKTLACAESLTGGLLGARLTAVPGASRVFRGGVISYASAVKFDLLRVKEGPVINEETAIAMAQNVRRLLKADCAVALTGVAGPESQDGFPPGTVCLAVVDDEHTVSRTVHFGNRGRNAVRELAATAALEILLRR